MDAKPYLQQITNRDLEISANARMEEPKLTREMVIPSTNASNFARPKGLQNATIL